MLYGVAHIWARYSLSRLRYSRHLSTTRAFHGDEVTFEIGIANRKVLPLPWVQIEEDLDEQMVLPEIRAYLAVTPAGQGGSKSSHAARMVSPSEAHLSRSLPKTWPFRLRSHQDTDGRLFPLPRQGDGCGGARVPHGLPQDSPLESFGHTLPRPIRRPPPPASPFPGSRPRFERPGLRPRRPMKRINWKASARVGRCRPRSLSIPLPWTWRCVLRRQDGQTPVLGRGDSIT